MSTYPVTHTPTLDTRVQCPGQTGLFFKSHRFKGLPLSLIWFLCYSTRVYDGFCRCLRSDLTETGIGRATHQSSTSWGDKCIDCRRAVPVKGSLFRPIRFGIRHWAIVI
jgi:hypothetical protein